MSGVWKREELQQRAAVVRPLFEMADETKPPVTTVSAPVKQPVPASAPASEGAGGRQLRLLNSLATSLVAEREQLLRDLRPEIIQLALCIAREVIGYEASVDRRVIEYALQTALERLNNAARVVARLHPDDLVELKGLSPETLGCMDEQVLELVADDSVESGGCRLESDRGNVEVTLDSQLRMLREALDWNSGR